MKCVSAMNDAVFACYRNMHTENHYCPTISQINSIGYRHRSLGLYQQNS